MSRVVARHKRFELIMDLAKGYNTWLETKSVDSYVFVMSIVDVSSPNLLRIL